MGFERVGNALTQRSRDESLFIRVRTILALPLPWSARRHFRKKTSSQMTNKGKQRGSSGNEATQGQEAGGSKVNIHRTLNRTHQLNWLK